MAARKAKLSRATTGKNDAPPSLHKVVPTRGSFNNYVDKKR